MCDNCYFPLFHTIKQYFFSYMFYGEKVFSVFGGVDVFHRGGEGAVGRAVFGLHALEVVLQPCGVGY